MQKKEKRKKDHLKKPLHPQKKAKSDFIKKNYIVRDYNRLLKFTFETVFQK